MFHDLKQEMISLIHTETAVTPCQLPAATTIEKLFLYFTVAGLNHNHLNVSLKAQISSVSYVYCSFFNFI